MSFLLPKHCLALLLSLISVTVLAQNATAPTSSLGVAPLSAFAQYQPYTEEKIVDWKTANDLVGRAGGWREYAKEAQQTGTTKAASQPASSPNPPVKP